MSRAPGDSVNRARHIACRASAFAAIAALAACASGNPGNPAVAGGSSIGAAPALQSVGVAGTSDRMTIAPGSGPNLNTVAAAVDQVWRALPAAFDSVGIPVTRMDPAGKVIGNDAFKIRQRLGKVPLSRYIDCGQTQIGPNADSYEVSMTLVVQVRAATPTSSALTTTFETYARPLAFSQGYSRCTSRGSLEEKFLAAVNAQLKR